MNSEITPNNNLIIPSIVLAIFVIVLAVVNQPVHTSASTVADTYVYLPVIQNNFDAALGTPIFGVQTYNNTRTTNKYYDALINSNASWVRTNVSWAKVELTNSSPDNYNWTSADNSLAISINPDINVIVTIDDNPGWAATSSGGVINLVGFAEFASFVGALAERYDGDGVDDAPGSPIVTYWELYNEPDAGSATSHQGWGDDPDLYAAMLQAVYPAVKNANPKAQIVLGGIAYDFFYDQNGPFNPDFLDGVLQFGGDYFDVMNFHAYPVFSKNWTSYDGPGLLQKTEAVRSKLATHGYGNRPIIITESGWHSNDTSANNLPASPAIQSQYVIKLFTQSLAADIDVMIWWMLFDPGGGYWENGLVTNDNPPIIKPAFVTYQTVVEELSAAHFKRAWTPTETGSVNVEVFEFEDNVHQRMVYVAWVDPVDTAQTATITLNGQQATVVKVNETSVVRTPITSGSGNLTITVTSQPIIIEVNK
ncbi:MAG: glycoside hydrolase family 5 protein [Chloroflexi bacterium]|nr:glycoside hydrolase family 5 protein [Chloroflexota bacterium]